MKSFKFELGSCVQLGSGSENGCVIGRAEYQNTENGYLVRYVAGDGRLTEVWWGESALSSIPEKSEASKA